MFITKISQQKKHKNLYSVYIDDIYEFSLEDIDLVKTKLKVGQEISQDAIDYYKDKYEYSKAKNSAIRYISYRTRSTKEVTTKLNTLGYKNDVTQRVIEWLTNENYLNDQQFAEQFIKERIKLKPSGKKLIESELKNKGIDPTIINKKISEFEFDDYNTAYNLVLKKAKNIKHFDRKAYASLYSFLIRKGFFSEVIKKVLKNYFEKDIDQED